MGAPLPCLLSVRVRERQILTSFLRVWLCCPSVAAKTLVQLRDGRKIIGMMRSFDQFANVVLEEAVERVIVGKRYADVPLGLYVIRGENVVLLGQMVRGPPNLPCPRDSAFLAPRPRSRGGAPVCCLAGRCQGGSHNERAAGGGAHRGALGGETRGGGAAEAQGELIARREQSRAGSVGNRVSSERRLRLDPLCSLVCTCVSLARTERGHRARHAVRLARYLLRQIHNTVLARAPRHVFYSTKVSQPKMSAVPPIGAKRPLARSLVRTAA